MASILAHGVITTVGQYEEWYILLHTSFMCNLVNQLFSRLDKVIMIICIKDPDDRIRLIEESCLHPTVSTGSTSAYIHGMEGNVAASVGIDMETCKDSKSWNMFVIGHQVFLKESWLSSTIKTANQNSMVIRQIAEQACEGSWWIVSENANRGKDIAGMWNQARHVGWLRFQASYFERNNVTLFKVLLDCCLIGIVQAASFNLGVTFC